MTAIKIAILSLPNLCVFKKRLPSNQPFVMGFFASLQSMTAFLQRQHGAIAIHVCEKNYSLSLALSKINLSKSDSKILS